MYVHIIGRYFGFRCNIFFPPMAKTRWPRHRPGAPLHGTAWVEWSAWCFGVSVASPRCRPFCASRKTCRKIRGDTGIAASGNPQTWALAAADGMYMGMGPGIDGSCRLCAWKCGGRGSADALYITFLGVGAVPPGAYCQTPRCHLVKRPRPRDLPDQIYCTVCCTSLSEGVP